MAHNIVVEGGNKYCKHCGLSDFSAECPYDRENAVKEMQIAETTSLKEKEILLKEKEMAETTSLKEKEMLLKEKEMLLKEKEILLKEKEIVVTTRVQIIVYFFLLLFVYVLYSGLDNVRLEFSRMIASCKEGGFLAIFRYLFKTKK